MLSLGTLSQFMLIRSVGVIDCVGANQGVLDIMAAPESLSDANLLIWKDSSAHHDDTVASLYNNLVTFTYHIEKMILQESRHY